MTTTMLTDDEVVALAVSRGEAWPTALPTIPSGSASTLTAAVNRGLRSLAVRGLAHAATDPATELGSAIDEVTRSTTRVAATVGPAARPDLVAGGGVIASIALGAAAWTVDSFSPNGVHAFSTKTASDVLDMIMAMARKAFGEGAVDVSGKGALGLALTSLDTSGFYLVVTRGSVMKVSVASPAEPESTVTAEPFEAGLERGAIAQFLGIRVES